MKKIKLSRGLFTVVDDEDFEYLNQFKWFAKKGGDTFYAVRMTSRTKGKRNQIWMHKKIINAKPGEDVDHKDGGGLNNLRENLRFCTMTENQRNSKLRKDSSSGYKGVSYHKGHRKFRARIQFDGRNLEIGKFLSKEAAAIAYNLKAKELFGEFARLNEI